MKDAASDLVIIDAGGHTFVCAEYVERISTGPSDRSVKQRFLMAHADFPDADCLIRCRQNKFFYSLRYLNRILSSPKSSTRPLRVNLAIRTDSEGDQHVVLGLQDLDGNNVSLEDAKSVGLDPLQVVTDQGSAENNAVSCGQSVDRIDIEKSLDIMTLDSP